MFESVIDISTYLSVITFKGGAARARQNCDSETGRNQYAPLWLSTAPTVRNSSTMSPIIDQFCTLVMRGSFFILKMKRSVWPVSFASSFLSASAFTTIERNLYIWNGLPRRPIRVCL